MKNFSSALYSRLKGLFSSSNQDRRSAADESQLLYTLIVAAGLALIALSRYPIPRSQQIQSVREIASDYESTVSSDVSSDVLSESRHKSGQFSSLKNKQP